MPGRHSQHRKTRRTINEPGHAHELTFSCYQRWALMSKDRVRVWFVEALNRARDRGSFDLWAWVIMPEHVHVLIRPREFDYDVGAILRSIKQPVAQRCVAYLKEHDPHWLERLKVVRPNNRVEFRFWQQGGGYDRNIVEPKTARTIVDYIHNNPVRRGLVENSLDWPWSSARWYAGCKDAAIRIDGAEF